MLSKSPETWRMKILKFLIESQGSTVKGTAKAIGVDWATVYNKLPVMSRLGHVKEVKRAEIRPDGAAIIVRRLYITKAGREWLELAKTL